MSEIKSARSEFIETLRYPALLHDMYKLIRRISSTFFPRPDRPWNDDATSNAPQIGKKRRMSDDEDVPEPSSIKRHRTGLAAEDTVILEETPTPEQESTVDGVKEVELEDHAQDDAKGVEPVATETAAAVPLPDSPILEAQTETSEVVASEAPAQPEKEETPRKPEGDSAEPAVPVAEETKITEDAVSATTEAAPTAEDSVVAATVEDATTTQTKDIDTTTHTTSDEVITEEKRTEVVAETA
ncbi:hypothetical protein PsYK624_093390 [Phanerochaete sordida]|uniref:Uncharacterized protein n=1 Tax=Phanerochaete sordida TaxID=48140 RepID=A0A9P3GGA1_9APHY|nr:hypothetical protein PsYK624_093390 [Phanerochaete sordida]